MGKLIFTILFSFFLAVMNKAHALSCAPDLCAGIIDQNELKLCEIRRDVLGSQTLVISKVTAESCVLGHKMNRREFIQAQCKAITSYEVGACGGNYYLCLPNGNNGNIFFGNKLYKDRAEFEAAQVNVAIPAGWISPIKECKNGQWVTPS